MFWASATILSNSPPELAATETDRVISLHPSLTPFAQGLTRKRYATGQREAAHSPGDPQVGNQHHGENVKLSRGFHSSQSTSPTLFLPLRGRGSSQLPPKAPQRLPCAAESLSEQPESTAQWLILQALQGCSSRLFPTRHRRAPLPSGVGGNRHKQQPPKQDFFQWPGSYQLDTIFIIFSTPYLWPSTFAVSRPFYN